MSTASSGYLIVEVISARRISAPPNSDHEYQASIQAGEQTFVTQPARISANSFAGQTLTWRERIVIRLNSTYDARRGLVILISSTCGKVQFGAASCAHAREWLQLSKPRGEVQVIFSQQWDTRTNTGGSSSSSSHNINNSGMASLGGRLGAPGRQRSQSAGMTRIQNNYGGGGGSRNTSPDQSINNPQINIFGDSTGGDGSSSPSDSYLIPSFQQRPLPPPTPSSARSLIGARPSTAATTSALKRVTTDSGNAGVERHVEESNTPCTVHVLSVELCNFAATLTVPDANLFFAIMFAQQEHMTTAKSVPSSIRSGYSGCWAERIFEFDVPVAKVVDRAVARVQLWEGQNKYDGKLLCETTISLRQASEVPEVISTTGKLAEFPGASIIVTAQGINQLPLREGKNGRPMSAFTRRGKSAGGTNTETNINTLNAANPNVTFHPDVQTPPQGRGAMTGGYSTAGAAAAPTTTTASSPEQHCQDNNGDGEYGDADDHDIVDDSGSSMDEGEEEEEDDPEGNKDGGGALGQTAQQKARRLATAKVAEDAQVELTLEAVGRALSQALETALNPVMTRISLLETRVQRTEQSLTGLLHHQLKQRQQQQEQLQLLTSKTLRTTSTNSGASGGGDDIKKNTRRSGSGGCGSTRSSRPGSAASQGTQESNSSYPNGKLCITQEELTQRFQDYDMFETGYLSKAQLIHFYRSSYSFASDESEDEIEEKLRRQVGKGLEEDRVMFNDFCRVALALAKA